LLQYVGKINKIASAQSMLIQTVSFSVYPNLPRSELGKNRSAKRAFWLALPQARFAALA
jgi:hypothetical protein